MYLRTLARRNKDGTVTRYLQLAHNVRNERGNAVAEVVHSFGREDELDRDALARLVRSISRFLDPAQAFESSAGTELVFVGSKPFGGGYLLDALWRRLGIGTVLASVAAARKLTPAIERLIFTLVANRALDPSSKRHALEWAASDVALPGVGDLGGDPQVFYRAMDFLIDAEAAIQEQVFFAVANLLNLEVDVLLFDTTSTYFETQDDDELRRYGHSKDHRPDRPQVLIGLAITKEGIPVRIWCWPGNASDKTVIRQVHDDLRAWSCTASCGSATPGSPPKTTAPTCNAPAGRCSSPRNCARATTTTPPCPARAATPWSPTTCTSRRSTSARAPRHGGSWSAATSPRPHTTPAAATGP